MQRLQLVDDGVTSNGQSKTHYQFHPDQKRAWDSTKRFIAIIAGTRGGKTSFGPIWLYREMQLRGPGNYLIAAPSYKLLDKGAVPEVEKLFCERLNLGRVRSHPLEFIFSTDGCEKLWGQPFRRGRPRIYFGHADEPESLEAMTIKAAWLDEVGQKKFKLESWEAIQRRLSIDKGRALLTTTPYNLGWLKQRVYDAWAAGDPDFDVISFDSLKNPAFPEEEYQRAMKEMPRWKFDMFYRGRFTRPAGLIYDCFDESIHKCPRFLIPSDWPRFLGLDFGGANTAGLFIAKDPGNGNLYAYREYGPAGGRTAKEHVQHLLEGEPGVPVCFGGAGSEGQWRGEFRAAGLPVREPDVKAVEVGIDRVYSGHKSGKYFVFNDLARYLDQKLTYSRKLNERGEPMEEIEDKDTYHLLDAERYIGTHLFRKSTEFVVPDRTESFSSFLPQDMYRGW